MTRSEIRENIFKMLFRAEFHEAEDMGEQLSLFEEELKQLKPKELSYIREKVSAIMNVISELDEKINLVVEGWKTSRMAKVDLSIIRLAVYEMEYEEDIPKKVSINEAVELAKKYGSDDSSGFVNGVLAKFI